MQEAIDAYRHISATDKFKELERMRSIARHNEASALYNAKNEGRLEERGIWQGVVAEKDAAYIAAITEKDALIAELQARLESGTHG